jgi:hypothetical protein
VVREDREKLGDKNLKTTTTTPTTAIDRNNLETKSFRGA